jgi:hypothetical protein
MATILLDHEKPIKQFPDMDDNIKKFLGVHLEADLEDVELHDPPLADDHHQLTQMKKKLEFKQRSFNYMGNHYNCFFLLTRNLYVYCTLPAGSLKKKGSQ